MRRAQTNHASITSARRYLEHVFATRGIDLPEIPQTCLISYSEQLLEMLIGAHRHESRDIGCTVPTTIHFVAPAGGSPFAALLGRHGAPMAAAMLEELIAIGFDRFVSVGAAGHPVNGDARPVPEAGSPIGHVVLPDRAFVHEGTSRHYGVGAEASFPSAPMAEQLSAALREEGVAHWTGPAATTDALYRETPEFIEGLVARGVLAIDMELSALFSVSDFYGRECVGLLYISDVIDAAGSWDIGLAGPEIRDVERRLGPVLERALGAL